MKITTSAIVFDDSIDPLKAEKFLADPRHHKHLGIVSCSRFIWKHQSDCFSSHCNSRELMLDNVCVDPR
jgi:hypothetical protein